MKKAVKVGLFILIYFAVLGFMYGFYYISQYYWPGNFLQIKLMEGLSWFMPAIREYTPSPYGNIFVDACNHYYYYTNFLLTILIFVLVFRRKKA